MFHKKKKDKQCKHLKEIKEICPGSYTVSMWDNKLLKTTRTSKIISKHKQVTRRLLTVLGRLQAEKKHISNAVEQTVVHKGQRKNSSDVLYQL